MAEVIFNIAGLRLPVIMACANRAVSAPINIWNDHQDSMTVRDAGWIQFYAETNQEAADLILQAYRIGEDHDVMLPVMVCVDGYTLTHALEIVDFPSQEEVDRFVPAFKPIFKLDPADPVTMGPLVEPSRYMETRYALHRTMLDAVEIIPNVAREFKKMFGRDSGGLLKGYRTEDAESVVVAMGSMVGNICEVVDELRDAGQRVGVLKLITHRPFPYAAVVEALQHVPSVAVLEKAISLGAEGPLFSDVKAAFYGKDKTPKLSGFVIGLGGRDVTKDSIRKVYKLLAGKPMECEFIDLKLEATAHA
jgi:pyruvate ferredoxin oxidoreductase alpha subunit